MKKRKRRSLKQQIVAVFVIVALLAALLLAFLLYQSAASARSRLTRSAETGLELFAMTLNSQMNSVESFMLETTRRDERFHRLGEYGSTTQNYLDAWELRQSFPAVFAANELLTGLLLHSGVTNLCLGEYGAVFDSTGQRLEQRAALEQQLQQLGGTDRSQYADWYLETIGGRRYLLRRISYQSAELLAAFDLEQVFGSKANLIDENEKVLVYDKDGTLLLGDADYDCLERLRPRQTGSAGLSVRGRDMIAVWTTVDRLTVLHLVPYRPSELTAGGYSWMLMVGSLLVILAIPFVWYYLRRVVFRPMNTLVDTMDRIGGGELSARPTEDYNNAEFAQVNETFNRMIDQITQLKIDRYEHQLEAERSKMAMLKMQIRPHFILNCLKSVYGLAETGHTADIQTMILSLGNHLRYILSYTQNTISLAEEVRQCHNYVTLTGIGQADGIELTCEIDPALNALRLPPVSLLTLVENSVKHGRVQGKPLKLQLTAKLLQSEDGALADLILRDNGPGFAREEDLLRLNREVPQEQNGHHVGLYNVLRRTQLLYGEGVAMAFSNNRGGSGAAVEMMIPLAELPQSEQDEESDPT